MEKSGNVIVTNEWEPCVWMLNCTVHTINFHIIINHSNYYPIYDIYKRPSVYYSKD